MDIILPSVVKPVHQKILFDFLTNVEEDISFKSKLVFGKHKNGLIFPVTLNLISAPSFTNGFKFVASFHLDKKLINASTAYMILDKGKYIREVNSGKILFYC